MKEKLIAFFTKAWQRLTCKHVYSAREYNGWFYDNRVDAEMDVRTHIYLQSCTKCGHKHLIRTYEEPVTPEDRKR